MAQNKSEITEVTLEYLLTKGEFSNAEEFSIFIEKLAKKHKSSLIDTIIDYCKEKDIEPSSIVKSITPSLKQKIQAEAERKNLLKIKTGKLP